MESDQFMKNKNSIKLFGYILIMLGICAAADWPTFRGNMQRTGYYPDDVGYPPNQPLWKVSIGSAMVSSPAIAADRLYIGARDGHIYALNTSSGTILWKLQTGGWIDSSPLFHKGTLTFGSRDGTIYMVDAHSGDILSRFQGGAQLSSVGVYVNDLLLSGLGPPLSGFGAYNFQSRTHKRSGAEWSIDIPEISYSSPATYDYLATIGAGNGKLYGIDISERDTIWSLQTKGGVYLSTPAIDNMTVYFAPGNYDRNVYAANLLSGKIQWKNQSDVLSQAFMKKRRTRHLSSLDCYRLLKHSPAKRSRIIRRLGKQGIKLPRVPIFSGVRKKRTAGSYEFIPLGGMKGSSVAVGKKNVYVIQKYLGYVLINDSLTDDKQMFALSAFNKSTGENVWNFTDFRNSEKLGYCSSPVVTKNLIYLGWGEGKLYALSTENGEKIWEHTIDGHILSSPAIAGEHLYAATMDGNLYAFRLSETAPGRGFTQSTYCYPNPARGRYSHIQVFVPRAGKMTMHIYNMADQCVFRTTKNLAAGDKYTYDWNIDNVANGIYFAHIKIKYTNGKKDDKVVKIAVLR